MATGTHDGNVSLPNIGHDYAPLNELILRAIRRFGDFSPSSINGDVQNMFIEFANAIVDDVLNHPYFNGDENLTYYISATDKRPIRDNIMLAGLTAYYSFQQMSEKTQGYQAMYYQSLNRTLWQMMNGGSTKMQLRPVDGGSNKDHSPEVSAVNGLPVTDE